MASRGMDDRRSLTPEGTRPISERVRGHNKWDVHAEGFEKVSAAEAKMSGELQIRAVWFREANNAGT